MRIKKGDLGSYFKLIVSLSPLLRNAKIHATADSVTRPTDLCVHSQQIYCKRKKHVNQVFFTFKNPL